MNSIYGFKLEKEHDSVWGARAIYDPKNFEIGFLPDRIEVINPEKFEPLKEWLKRTGLAAIRARIHSAKLKESSNEELGYSEDGFTIKATPRGSYGYMYLVAYPI